MLTPVLVYATGGAVLGDQLGYLAGRLGAESFHQAGGEKPTGRQRFRPGEGPRSPLGGCRGFHEPLAVQPARPTGNLAAGSVTFSWFRFTLWGVSGEALWAAKMVGLGMVINSSIQAVADLLGDFTWRIVSGMVAVLSGWKLLSVSRGGRAAGWVRRQPSGS